MYRKVSVIGGGSWGTTVAKVVGENYARKGKEEKVTLWIYEEKVGGRNLTEIINMDHVNTKYLPGVSLPENVQALSSVEQAVEGAEIVLLTVPHEFLDGILNSMKGKISKSAILVILTKGFFFKGDKMELISENIKKSMGVRVCTLMGANIAGDVANCLLSECTLGYEDAEARDAVLELFESPYFKVNPVLDSGCVEVCGTLKNVVAIGCGIVAGNKHGVNTLAAVIRNGLLEMVRFCDQFIKKASSPEAVPRVFFESCGLADLIVTCTSGRNFKFSKLAAEKGISISKIETEEMNGQKLQGYSTIKELIQFMGLNKIEKEYPFLYAISISATTDLSADKILQAIQEK
ncbi:glycerol-3-phosphate dehydrogenase (NAD+) [Nematocida major]|uniref:glycerol-3-phosphate dehydrogenase (NAD+) n=1 Tax=Nematocida major TaxID=1912982 RepID=UPI002007B110|nr:glycerol-3-phosphate dehydrogenase (NAD+) [Nematocida major]KAH9385198.1 glycerol-3-phosphate dehydrogenase (NAD+) [Nematocida major]